MELSRVDMEYVSIWNMGRYVILVQNQNVGVFGVDYYPQLSVFGHRFKTEVPGIGEIPHLNADCNLSLCP